ncbi:MAG: ABC transporter substrate-binding protein [Actinobacteria bacterium]|nr:ABC transporter substrate-binding protein [Actinomycetota bacterium]
MLSSTRWSPEHRGSLFVVVGLILACALTLAACGGGESTSGAPESAGTGATEPSESASSGGTGGATTAGDQVSGEPIVTWTYADVNTEGPPYKSIEETGRVYQEWVNAHGGIDGRPLEVNFCDSRGTPTAAAACAREAVAGHAVAVVGSFNYSGDVVMPILEKGDTALFGGCCSITPAEYTSKASFSLGNGPLFSAGMVKSAVAHKCEHIKVLLQEGAESYKPLIDNAAKAEGVEIEQYVKMPATAQDFSPQAAELTSGGTDCVLMFAAESLLIAFMPAWAQSGSEAQLYGPQGNFDENAVKGFESLVEGDIVGGIYPDISSPAWADYREALETYEAESGLEYNSLAGLGAWSGYEAFKQIVEGMKGPINNETFFKAAETAKIDLPGMVPPVDFAKTWGTDGGPKGFERLANRCAVLSEFNGEGKLVPLSTEFEDVSELGGGTKPMDCGPPFPK